MKLNAYAKINLILNVLGTRPDGYHEVEMLMQAISLCDVVTVEAAPSHVLCPGDFEYGEGDLAWKAALLMAQTFRPELVKGAGEPGIEGIRIDIEKRIPAAAGLAGGSADAAAVMAGLAGMWGPEAAPGPSSIDDAPGRRKAPGAHAASASAFGALRPLAASLGSDVPFCLAAQLGRPAAIATGTGTTLEFVEPLDCGVTLYFSERTIPNKTRAVYAELADADCRPRYDIRAFLTARSLNEKRALAGNHLQAPAERLMKRFGIEPPAAAKGTGAAAPLLCGAGPTYFSLGKTGPYRTVTR